MAENSYNAREDPVACFVSNPSPSTTVHSHRTGLTQPHHPSIQPSGLLSQDQVASIHPTDYMNNSAQPNIEIETHDPPSARPEGESSARYWHDTKTRARTGEDGHDEDERTPERWESDHDIVNENDDGSFEEEDEEMAHQNVWQVDATPGVEYAAASPLRSFPREVLAAESVEICLDKNELDLREDATSASVPRPRNDLQPFVCRKCDHAFSRYQELKLHFGTSHRDTPRVGNAATNRTWHQATSTVQWPFSKCTRLQSWVHQSAKAKTSWWKHFSSV